MATVMLVVPAATPIAKPVVEMVAVATVSLAQVAWELMSSVEPSVNVAVAINCCVTPKFSFNVCEFLKRIL
jgi:hypothetical protein